jgi:hypothetical protein
MAKEKSNGVCPPLLSLQAAAFYSCLKITVAKIVKLMTIAIIRTTSVQSKTICATLLFYA